MANERSELAALSADKVEDGPDRFPPTEGFHTCPECGVKWLAREWEWLHMHREPSHRFTAVDDDWKRITVKMADELESLRRISREFARLMHG